jgi:hypothetical protein
MAMKTIKLFILVIIFLPVFLAAQDDSEKEAIKKVIQSAYVDGLQNKGPVSDIEKGFHPGFELLGNKNNELTKFPIYSWIMYHKKRVAENPNPPTAEELVTSKFPLIDITGNAAIVKIELYKGGNILFTDYLSLYEFEEGWQIVSKIYFRHEQK